MDEKVFKSKFAEMLTGDKSAFTDIYNDIKTPVFTVILRLVQNRAEAEDIMQELFLRLLRHGKDDGIKNPRAYIFMTARNIAIDSLRKKGFEELSEEIPDSADNEYASCQRMDIESALAKLSIKEREIVSLHLNAGLKFKEIAAIQDIPLGTALFRYNSAIKKLRGLL